MPFLLDTNAAIGLMKGHAGIVEHVRQVGYRQLRLCATVEGELWFGVANSSRPDENAECLCRLLDWLPSVPFDGDAPRRYGKLRAYLAKQGKPIGPYDLQIAAIARAENLVLVTNNTSEFERVPDIKLEDWTV